MKRLIILLQLVVFALVANAQGSITVIESAGNDDYYALGMSSDGNYITGQVGNQHHLFVWKNGAAAVIERDDNALSTQSDRANARGVSKNGLVAGICPNPAYPFEGDPEGINRGSYIATAAVFQYNPLSWTFLPVEFTSKYGLFPGYASQAWAITDDGTMAVGGQSPGGETFRRSAGYWKGTTPGNMTYTALLNDVLNSRGSIAKAVSGDGKVIGGFKSIAYNFTPIPVYWTYNEGTSKYVEKTISGASAGSVEGISNNGKYIALTRIAGEIDGRAYLFDVERERLIEVSNEPSAALGVSNNGVVVGHFGAPYSENNVSRYAISYGRHVIDANGAFIFTETMGVKPLKEFFDEENITYPDGFNFKAATAISTDGRIICGHGILNGKSVSFRAEIPVITAVGVFTPQLFKVESPAYGSIQLSWEAVPESSSLKGYAIYSPGNNTPLHTTTAMETSYTFTSLPDGTYSYYVVASYTGKNAPATKVQTITMGKKPFNGLFLDEFNYPVGDRAALRAALWDISTNTMSDSWTIKESGLPANEAFFLTPIGGDYDESLTSPYFDASESNNLRLSFVITIPMNSPTEKLAVELFDGENWQTIDDISATSDNARTVRPRTYNVSEYAGKDNIRVRFRCHGTVVAADLNWFIDNVELADEAHGLVEEPPLAVSARYVAKEGTVHLNWVEPHGYVSLRYMDLEEPVAGMGNAGESFIAANLYPAENIQIYDGYQLTSLSFIKVTNLEPAAPITVEPRFKWFVSQGGVRKLAENVVITNEIGWNSIQLAEPITIDASQPLYYGVEVVQHDAEDQPIGVGNMWKDIVEDQMNILIATATADGRGNVYSEDGGITWKKLSDGELKTNIFCVRATLVEDLSVQPKERLLGYRIFRDGVNLKEGFYSELNNYTDTIPLLPGEKPCYEIQAFYNSGFASEGVESCITAINSIHPINGENDLKAYPNLIRKGETITVELSNQGSNAVIGLYDLSGKKIKEVKAGGQKTAVQLDVDPGVYFLKVNDKGTVKIVVK